ncbi:MAG: aconitase X catalytic domain-containing protein [Acidiferrobacterales bacterium]|nr:aconitase X catalytic domain-containing protein [Acidiferrobacterales bacterium]
MTSDVKLTSHEKQMLDGRHGYPRQWAMEQQLKVAQFFGAEDFVEVTQAHIMCDTESLGEAGIAHVEKLARSSEESRKVVIPAVTDPRGIEFSHYRRFGQPEEFARREQRLIDALQAMGVLMTDTCINYQTVAPPVFGEHLAFGDTGSVIYANSVFGARSNFEGGPAALSAALTGRVPRYGYHLDECRVAIHHFRVDFRPRTLSDWGALGAVIGREAGSYWNTPWISGIDRSPTSDELKHFGAAMASYGSVPLFHIQGVTPQALNCEKFAGETYGTPVSISRADIERMYAKADRSVKVDVVVFAAPQVSLFEVQDIVRFLDGRRINPSTELLIATSPEIKSACDRFGLTEQLEQSGATVLSGVCFYQMYARELGQLNDWRMLVSNSAKLVNIIAGYGYEPKLATMQQCVDAALTGVL